MKKVVIGTSGYSYRDWMGEVYPAGTEKGKLLSFYSREFKMVELNFSYYRQPEAAMLSRMCSSTPDDFLFTIKAHKSMTHTRGPSIDIDITQFRQGIEPLRALSKLGAILFQFPYSFHYTIENRKFMDRLFRQFQEYPIALEFRNREWMKDSVFRGLGNRNIAFVNVDEPALDKLIPPGEIVTSPLSYIRFHGRNAENWWTGNNETRYDYLYSPGELEEWVPRIEEILKNAKLLLIAFNNHYKGKAVDNARELKKILQASLKHIEVY